MIRRSAVAALVVCLGAACGVEVTGELKQAELEQEISDRLEESVGVAPDAIDCPGDLEGSTGTEMRCELTAGGDVLGVTVTVTSVEDGRIFFDAEVDEQ